MAAKIILQLLPNQIFVNSSADDFNGSFSSFVCFSTLAILSPCRLVCFIVVIPRILKPQPYESYTPRRFPKTIKNYRFQENDEGQLMGVSYSYGQAKQAAFLNCFELDGQILRMQLRCFWTERCFFDVLFKSTEEQRVSPAYPSHHLDVFSWKILWTLVVVDLGRAYALSGGERGGKSKP